MKKYIFLLPASLLYLSVCGQGNRTEQLRSLEQGNERQTQQVATLKRASRLFGDKYDMTSVIVVIPSGTEVNVLDKDSTYIKVSYEDDEGYIFSRDAELSNKASAIDNASVKEENQQADNSQDSRKANRFAYLEYKYGSRVAALLYAGKIWKGMSADMVRDSWGAPLKINRVIGDMVKEEWIYKNTWLFIESERLIDWGPVKN